MIAFLELGYRFIIPRYGIGVFSIGS